MLFIYMEEIKVYIIGWGEYMQQYAFELKPVPV